MCAAILVLAACAVDGLAGFARELRVVLVACACELRVALADCFCASCASDAVGPTGPRTVLPYLWAGAGVPEPTLLKVYQPRLAV